MMAIEMISIVSSQETGSNGNGSSVGGLLNAIISTVLVILGTVLKLLSPILGLVGLGP